MASHAHVCQNLIKYFLPMKHPSTITLLVAASLALAAHANHAGGVVTNAAELVRLLYVDPTPGMRFDLTGTVTFAYSDETLSLVLTDGTGAVIMDDMAERCDHFVRVGDVIWVTGTTIRHPQRPVRASFSELKILQHGHAPAAQAVGIADLLSGKYDFRLTRFCGMVRECFVSETNRRWFILVISDKDETIYVSIPRHDKPQADIDRLLGATVAVTGVSLPYDGGYRIQTGRWFKCSGLDAVEVPSPTPEDPFTLPDVKTLSFMRPAEISRLGLHTLSGLVTATWGKGHVLVRTAEAKTVRIDLRRPPYPQYGDHIDVVGFPESNLYNINLTAAIWRPSHNAAAIAEDSIQTVTTKMFQDQTGFNMRYDGTPIRLQGEVRDISQDGCRVLVSDDGYSVSALLDALPPKTRATVTVGCRIEISGTCVMDIENWRPNTAFPHIKGFSLVVRSPQDVIILSRPSWWTKGKLMAVIGTLLSVLAGFFAWNRSLKKLAERRGNEFMRERLGKMKSELKVVERTRLAVELHDSLAQSLTGVSMELEAAEALKGHSPPEMLVHMQRAAQALKSCRGELRNCLWDLRSQALEEPDMTKAILRTLQPQINDSRLAVRFNVPRTDISDNITHAILNIARELVVNAIRHGDATVIKVAGNLDGALVRMSVQDNGCGFDPDTCLGVLQGHFGLQGIRERVEQLGGDMTIDSNHVHGTKISISLPAKEPDLPMAKGRERHNEQHQDTDSR